MFHTSEANRQPHHAAALQRGAGGKTGVGLSVPVARASWIVVAHRTLLAAEHQDPRPRSMGTGTRTRAVALGTSRAAHRRSLAGPTIRPGRPGPATRRHVHERTPEPTPAVAALAAHASAEALPAPPKRLQGASAPAPPWPPPALIGACTVMGPSLSRVTWPDPPRRRFQRRQHPGNRWLAAVLATTVGLLPSRAHETAESPHAAPVPCSHAVPSSLATIEPSRPRPHPGRAAPGCVRPPAGTPTRPSRAGRGSTPSRSGAGCAAGSCPRPSSPP